jgi:hypothetical protein
MPTKPLTLQQKQANDMKRSQREVANMGREGMTMRDPVASRSKAPLQALSGGSLTQPAQTQRQRINNRPVFRSAALTSGPGVQGPAVRGGPLTPPPGMAQPPPGLFSGLEGPAQDDPSQYVAANMFAQQQGQQQPMAPDPIFRMEGGGGPMDLSELPPGFFDEYLAGGGASRFEASPTAGTLSDYYGRDINTDFALDDPPLPEPPAEPAAPPDSLTELERMIIEMMGQDTAAQQQAAEERMAREVSQARADAQAQMAGSGFMGSGVATQLGSDIGRAGSRALNEELLAIQDAAADRAVQAGGLGLGLEDIRARERAMEEVRGLMDRLFDDGTGGNVEDVPTESEYTPDETSSSWLDSIITGGDQAINAMLGTGKYQPDRASVPGDATYQGLLRGQEIWRAPDGTVYLVPASQYEGPPQGDGLDQSNEEGAGANTPGNVGDVPSLYMDRERRAVQSLINLLTGGGQGR